MWSYLQNRWQSLVFRLLFYFLISMLALAIAVGVSFTQRFKPHVRNEILPNLERYIEYLIDDMGLPPEISEARRLADDLPFEIRIEGQGMDWSSSPRLGPIDDHEFRPAPPPHEQVYLSQDRRDQYLMVQRQGYRYLFAVDDSFRRHSERRHGFLLLFLGLVLVLLYLAIRRMLRPIEAISRQVAKIGEGDLEQTIDERGGNELASLAAGVNRMSARIKSMLESKSGLLLAISHELRSPLTRMRINLELLEDGKIRNKLIDDLREIENLVAAILESEKLGSGHAPLNLRRCQLMHLVEEVVAVHPSADRIVTSLTPIEIAVDELRLKLLIKNLIDNACHYSRAGNSAVEVRLLGDADSASIEVHDQGIGIDPEELPRLTEAFYRPDSARGRDTGGYGLGLYLCKLIVDAHRGRLSIDSEPGKGTCVVVDLPFDNS
ncbi:MAG TPA: HAMP domain-containing sensor histidine kinase [Gammaproteobacteria bacterium]|nr:HAMP domain-containing sensor histidine kinase [Gammaproteobacteria bacterium]